MKVTRQGLLAVALAACLAVPALAAGIYSTLPIVGGSSFCASTVSGTGNLGGITGQGQGTLGSICAQTVPAGPPVVTGNELIPADEPSTNGGQPQTVVLTLASLNALPIAWVNAATSGAQTFTATPMIGGIILSAASTIASAIIVPPSTPIDGQQFQLDANQTVTSLQFSPVAGQGAANFSLPTVMTGSTTGSYGYKWIWHAANSQWWRLQ